jgi:hypothetical protein
MLLVGVSRRAALSALPAAAVAVLAAGACSRGDGSLPERRVLFLGNSFTDGNGGLDTLLTGLAPRAHAERVSPGGLTLARHEADPATLDRLADPEGWDVVVLQEQSQTPVFSYGAFAGSLQRLAARVRSAGARPVALETWTRPDSPGVTTRSLAEAYRSAASLAGTSLAPAGEAFATSLRLRPDLALYERDGHPTEAGSYLAACVVLRAVYGAGPAGNGFTGDLDTDTARLLQGVAAAQPAT